MLRPAGSAPLDVVPAQAGSQGTRAAPPRRVRMELAGPTGVAARRNMPPGIAAMAPLEGAGDPGVVHD